MENRIPLLGEKFPTLVVNTTHGKITLPDDFTGKWFILFSHPGDFTPVCTTEFVAFQKRYNQFKELNCELIGESVNQVFAHLKWVEWIKDNLNTEITFPIIADNNGRVASALGLIHPNKGSNTVRAVFIVDPKATIRAILYYPQELGRNMDEFVRMIKAFQVADQNKVAMPADWPENDLIGDHVIVPPPADENGVNKRRAEAEKGEIECYDWWLCHKKLESKK